MKIVPQAFYTATTIKKVMVDGNCCIVHKKTEVADLDNQRLLAAHALTVVLNGGLVVHSDDGLPIQVGAGEMVLLPRGLYAITDLIPDDGAFEAIVFFFDDDVTDTFLEQRSINQEIVSSEKLPTKFSLNRPFKAFIEQTLTLYGQVKLDSNMVRGKLLEILHLIAEFNPNGHFLEKVAELKVNPKKDLSLFMLSHFDKPLAVETFANLSGRSVSSFRRDFHRDFNMAPKKWLIKRRLDKAQELLTKEYLSITDVAIRCGFSDIPHFIKSFEKQFATTPKQYALANYKKIQAN
ncbi:hypothetical protein BFP97_14465 [Roseivirga sp. 4D4]|uniref:AraC family transcriptional regulator n=1 Tax=Roseivirga sp. 4D4 TaxID=1889784 RepID=UPI000853BA2A|nr:AraC family transcriptional regulator [Roseivirga sp. 4D4]OEK02651.1 hypothetical protein BFP97_14465 [Roseivirga sp. 4D4]